MADPVAAVMALRPGYPREDAREVVIAVLKAADVEVMARALAWKRERFWIGHDDDDRMAIVDLKWPEYADDLRAAIDALVAEIEGNT